MATVLEWARRYVGSGLSVIPVRADGSKAPALPEWRQFTDRRATDAELVEWFGGEKDYGIGVVPGPASGNLAVLDFEKSIEWNPEGEAYKEAARRELRGHDLACFCRLDEPCHADILLRIANA